VVLLRIISCVALLRINRQYEAILLQRDRVESLDAREQVVGARRSQSIISPCNDLLLYRTIKPGSKVLRSFVVAISLNGDGVANHEDNDIALEADELHIICNGLGLGISFSITRAGLLSCIPVINYFNGGLVLFHPCVRIYTKCLRFSAATEMNRLRSCRASLGLWFFRWITSTSHRLLS